MRSHVSSQRRRLCSTKSLEVLLVALPGLYASLPHLTSECVYCQVASLVIRGWYPCPLLGERDSVGVKLFSQKHDSMGKC